MKLGRLKGWEDIVGVEGGEKYNQNILHEQSNLKINFLKIKLR